MNVTVTVPTSYVYPVCNCAKEDNALMFLSTVYGEEDYKESYSFTEVTILFTTQETQKWLAFMSGR